MFPCLRSELLKHFSLRTACLISIHERYARHIYGATKLYEFRKVKPDARISLYIIYETSPIKMITGAFRSDFTISDTPDTLWTKLSTHSGINKDDFFKYYTNHNIGHAISISDAVRFSHSYKLSDLHHSIVRPPQSFQYVTLG